MSFSTLLFLHAVFVVFIYITHAQALYSLFWPNNVPLYKYLSFQGINGSVNGNSASSSVLGVGTSVLSTPTSSSMGQNQSTSSGGGNLKCHQEQSKSQPLDARADKIKDKVSCFFKNMYIMNQYIKEIF